ncbi:MAG: DNA-formamidopyrimidine glycosylase family protein, partial [Patescibacteria group bacterium]
MPELPEVETIKRGLSRLIVGKKILEVTTDSAKQVKPSIGKVKKAIVGSTIKKVERRAKIIQIFLSNGRILIFHLKLTGRLLVRKKGTPEDKWQHVTFSLSGNKELRFADSRKFGWVKLIEGNKELEKILDDYGPEPLDGLTLK